MGIGRRLIYYLRFLKSVVNLNCRLLHGMWRLTRLSQPAVTVFGGVRVELQDKIAQQALQLSKELAELGYSIITGGGPGIMEAANFGAYAYQEECKLEAREGCRELVSVGIGLEHLNQERVNPYVQTNIIMDHFFSRKWLLVRYSSAFVVFPGGFGTLDELFEIVVLVQTGYMAKFPIILIGSHYWKPLLNWVDTHIIAGGFAENSEKKIMTVVDEVEDAVAIIQRYHGQKIQ